MGFQQKNGLRYYEFDSFHGLDIAQAIFTRQGGVSPAPWESLNLGGTVGDERQNVVENRQRCFDVVGRPVESIFDVWQVHSTNVIYADAPRPLESSPEKADAIFTDQPEVTLLMRFADCTPILLVDPLKRVVGLVHAGWIGTVNQIARVSVESMQTKYGSVPETILAGIGPSICVDHYPVGPEVVERFKPFLEKTLNVF